MPSPAPARPRRPTIRSAPSIRTSASSRCRTRGWRELQKIAKTNVVIPAAIEFVDIAGLVKGASQGEGLGNKFLTHIREVDADRPGRALLRGCGRASRVGHRRSGARHRGDQHRADARRSRGRCRSGASGSRRTRSAATRPRPPRTRCSAKIEAALDAGKPALTVELTPEERALSRAVLPAHRQADDLRLQRRRRRDLATADTNPYVHEGARLRADAPRLRGGRDQRADRERPGRSGARRGRRVPQGARRRRRAASAR